MARDKQKRSLEGISLVEKTDTKRISARRRNWTTRSHAQPFKCSIELEKKVSNAVVRINRIKVIGLFHLRKGAGREEKD